MYALDKIKLNIVKVINQALDPAKAGLIQASDLIYPPNREFGDLSLPCFIIAKELKKAPAETASWLMKEISKKELSSGCPELSSFKTAGPYLNFTLNKNYLGQAVINEIGKEKDNYGKNKSGKNKRVMVEYSNANTHKEFHVGHLRNLCFGDAVGKLLTANGYKSIPVSYINDFGIHTAKTLWALETFFLNHNRRNRALPCSYPTGNKGYFLGKVYARAVKEMERDKTAKDMVSFMMKKIESRKGGEYKLWQKTRKWSIDSLAKIYKELGVKFDHIFYESDFIDKGMEMAADLYKKEFLIKSDGAIIADLNKYGLGVLLFLRSDGTALYPVADLPLAVLKFKKYKLDKSIYVVDARQSLYFKQMFKVLELLGHNRQKFHLGYEFVKLPSGMMSSREGRVITYEDLREQLMNKAVSETKKRHKDWSAKKTEEVSTKIVNGAVKFEMLKVGAGQIITFDINSALRFDGFTAAYLQYTYARIQSIVRKSKVLNSKSETNPKSKIQNSKFKETEYGLIIKLAKYPEAVQRAGESYDPSEMAKYLSELARIFNDYYHSAPVLKAEKETREARLILIGGVARVIKNGLKLLGIDVVEEM